MFISEKLFSFASRLGSRFVESKYSFIAVTSCIFLRIERFRNPLNTTTVLFVICLVVDVREAYLNDQNAAIDLDLRKDHHHGLDFEGGLAVLIGAKGFDLYDALLHTDADDRRRN